MTTRIVLFTQPGCLSCELMRVFLEAKEVTFEERDITKDLDARREMMEEHESTETPTIVVFASGTPEVIVGFDPVRLDEYLSQPPFCGPSES